MVGDRLMELRLRVEGLHRRQLNKRSMTLMTEQDALQSDKGCNIAPSPSCPANEIEARQNGGQKGQALNSKVAEKR